MTLATMLRKPILIATLALMAFAALAGGADARSNPEDGEISGPYQYVIRANPAIVAQDVVVQPQLVQGGR
jgi:hypothetical protein